MRHTDDEIERASSQLEQLADELDPATGEIDHADDLRAIAAVCEAVRADEARLREAVEVARAHDRSWIPDRGRPGSLPASSPAAVHRQDARLIDRIARSNGYVLIDRCRLGGTRH
jgi:hypothetical protein